MYTDFNNFSLLEQEIYDEMNFLMSFVFPDYISWTFTNISY